MSVEVKTPTLGESIVEATVGRWLKREGEAVAEGEPLVELETDKVNMEVVAPGAGTLEKITKQTGETVGVGETLATIGAAAAATSAPVADTPATEARAQANGAAQSNGNTAPVQQAVAPQTAPVVESAAHPATPLARRMAEDNGVDLARLTGSGPGGRVTQDDVAAYLARTADSEARATSAPVPVAPTATPAPVAPPAPAHTASVSMASATTPNVAPAAGRPEERVRMSRRRQTIARRLVEAQHTAAMLTTFNEVDMSAIMDVRKRRRDAFKERHGVGLGFMSFFTKAVIGALKAFPRLNAEIQGDEMLLKRYYDIGIAVGVAEGLVVPVVRDADRLSFAQIESQIAALAEKARKNTLSLDDLLGGTFTITNGGTFGSLLSTPILNTPQVGILGMHKIEERPIALNGQVVIHPMMYVALSYDHRIVDGSEAVGFLVRVKELLEDPERLLLEG